MKNHFKKILALALSATTIIGCNLGVSREDAETLEGYYYEGYIYDGVTSERLTDFSISASQRGMDVDGSVEDDGHFLLGPIKPDHDYVVTIEAEDYREFFAAESGAVSFPSSIDGQQTFYYEAFLFPEDILSPEVDLSFYTPDGIDARPNGALRLTPTVGDSLSAIHLGPTTTTPSVGGQAWSNDADRRFRTVTFDVEDGEVTVAEGELVYGVTYTGTIYGSDGYAYGGFSYTSGLEGDRTLTLDRLDPQALALTHNSLEISNRDADAEIVLTFNHPIELSDVVPADQLRETIDDAFTIDSPNLDGDADTNVLISNIGDDPDARDRGTSLTIDGNTLTLSWARDDSNFATMDPDDPIESVTYDSLDDVVLRIADGRVDQEVNLSTLLGTSSLTVYVDGVAATDPPPPLALNSTVTNGTQTGTGLVTVAYTFNRDIAFDTDFVTQQQMAESIDNAFSMTSTDTNAPTSPATLPGNSLPTVQENGTTIGISGATLTLSWDRSVTTDPLDTFTSVTFGGLNNIAIRPVGTTGAEDTTLGAFAGASEAFALDP